MTESRRDEICPAWHVNDSGDDFVCPGYTSFISVGLLCGELILFGTSKNRYHDYAALTDMSCFFQKKSRK